MVFVFQHLFGASLALAFVYLISSGFVYQRLSWLQANSTPGLNTRKLFVMTCLLMTVLRFMSFSSMALLNLGRVNFHVESSGTTSFDDDNDEETSSDEIFLQKAAIVLFDFPDFCCISAYVLLMVVWSELYCKSRRHWLSSFQFRKNWMLVYFAFNIILYSSQVALYSLLFFPTIDGYVQASLIYLASSAFNLCIPLFWLCAYFYLAVKFSGFPYSTRAAKLRLKYLSNVGITWTIARITFGLVALTSITRHWLGEVQKNEAVYSVLVVIFFILVEILPLYVSMRYHVLQSLADSDDDINNPNNATNCSTSQDFPHIASFTQHAQDDVIEVEKYDEDHLSHLLSPSNHSSGAIGNSRSTRQSSLVR